MSGEARWVAALVAVLAALAVVVASCTGSAKSAGEADADPPASTAAVAQPASPRAAEPARRTGSVIPERPRSVRLPSGRTVPVVPVSTLPDGTLDVPGDVDVSGWWRGGSRIGDPFGSVLLSAHVDSATQGLGPYAELLGVSAGDTVVLSSAGLRQEYAVSSLRLLDKGALADDPSISSPAGPHRLTLVTCAGPFVPSRGGYQRLAVVTAEAVSPPTEKSS
ncbi:hypothetical protein GCM10009797_39890 [Nocardioides hwasunensis]